MTIYSNTLPMMQKTVEFKPDCDDIFTMSYETTEEVVQIPISVRRDHSRTKKLTAVKKQQVIDYLLNVEFHPSKAAASVGVTRRALNMARNSDDKFNASYDLAKQFHLDNCKSAMFTVASKPTREGFNDRQLALRAYEPEKFGNQLEVKANHTLNINFSIPELNQILQKHQVQRSVEPEAIPEAGFEVLP